MEEIWELLGITGWQLLSVTTATIVLFAVYTAVISLYGQRRAKYSVATTALFALLGAVTARSMLGLYPTLATGLLVLAILMLLQAAMNWVRHNLRRLHPRRAKAVILNGETVPDMLHRIRLTENELWVKLRLSGVTQISDVQYAIVETDGSLTVIRAGAQIDPRLLTGVIGIQ